MTPARIDHLVVVASSLAEGAAWCERTLGVAPGAGGEHPLMGTHNRLLRIATVDHPRAYLEIIAIDPHAPEAPRRAGARWFDMDDASLQAAIAKDGPRLAHFVANLPDLSAALAELARLGIDRGEALRATRMTPRGLLEWQISVRPDGQRLYDGCLPTLIQWGDSHPVGTLPECGIALQSLTATHPRAAELRRAFEAVGLGAVSVSEGPANLCATLMTPLGRVRLESKGL